MYMKLGQRLFHYYKFYAKVFGTWYECDWRKKVQLLF